MPTISYPGPAAPAFDTSVPVLVFKIGPNPIHHGTLAIIRSLGRAGVPVYAIVEDRFTPAASSRYLARHFIRKFSESDRDSLMCQVLAISSQLGRPAVIIPADDVGAVWIAENAERLRPFFLFPRIDPALPGLLSNKRSLSALCRKLGIPTPALSSPDSLDAVEKFASQATFPVVVKADARTIARGSRSVSLVHTREALLAIWRATPFPDGLAFQEYIPKHCAEDWIFQAYSNPAKGCLLSFTGRKQHSWPAFAGPTVLGVAASNAVLREQSERLIKAIGYVGVMDLDYRFDKRDGQYKLLDFNPRVGANFRLFESRAAVDVVRALHLDLTGRKIPQEPQIEGRRVVVESQYWLASLTCAVRGEMTFTAWLKSFCRPAEFAWLSADDRIPAFVAGARLLFRICRTLLRRAFFRMRQPFVGRTRQFHACASGLRPAAEMDLPPDQLHCPTKRATNA